MQICNHVGEGNEGWPVLSVTTLWPCHNPALAAQNAMSFEMTPYLLGAKGPAQCIHFTSQPMKVHLVPRAGGPPQVRASFQLLDEASRHASLCLIVFVVQ